MIKMLISGRAVLAAFVLILMLSSPLHSRSAANPDNKVITLNKTGEIREDFSNEEINYFWNIDALCCDNVDNLYVADSGWSKIFKFDSNQNYLMSFGKAGQGPGEFLAQPGRFPLQVSSGNDHKIYVTDTTNRKLLLFSNEGAFERSFILSPNFYDSAQVNSKGDIYLISQSESHVIDRYDKRLKHKGSFLSKDLHFRYPLYRKPRTHSDFIDDISLKKIVTPDDHIIVFSNISLSVFHFDKRHKLVNEFMVDHKAFLDDFRRKLKQTVDMGRFMYPFFHVAVDGDAILYFFYYNKSIEKEEIYRYRIDGTFLDTLRFPETTLKVYCVDKKGNIFAVLENSNIGVFKAK